LSINLLLILPAAIISTSILHYLSLNEQLIQ